MFRGMPQNNLHKMEGENFLWRKQKEPWFSREDGRTHELNMCGEVGNFFLIGFCKAAGQGGEQNFWEWAAPTTESNLMPELYGRNYSSGDDPHQELLCASFQCSSLNTVNLFRGNPQGRFNCRPWRLNTLLDISTMPTPESAAFLAKKPKVPPTFDGVDYDDDVRYKQAQDAIIREQWVQVMMGRLVREELSKCYYKEGINHLEKCGHLRGETI